MRQVEKMMQDIAAEVEYTRHYIGRDALAPRVLNAIRKVPRHEFVPEETRRFAYENGPASIGYGQTISQPYIVALMTDLLEPQKQDIILEVGTGSGYQAAVLSLLVKHVYTLEIVPELGGLSRERLQRLGYHNVTARIGDGYAGWPEHAPFDGIILTAAATHLPPALLDQLKPGGRMVLPVGLPYLPQELLLVEKDAQGQITTTKILDVAFVPLTGEHVSGPAKLDIQ
ncbi:MAG: protein-L-isoaspartate O-methyltransferase [Gammaproteobacteria bacterium RBG_16_57_12]|nr:MAG: protein-L-isoaspartate O-methyltransferase [Gammaproteobacteria bacterium RBG_16_57_12]